MIILLPYIIKLSIGLAVMYLFYQLLLRRLTFYNWNRWYLLCYSIAAFFIPFIDVDHVLQQNSWTDSQMVGMIPVVDFQATTLQIEKRSGWTTEQWIIAVFIAGVMVMFTRLLIQQLSFKKLMRSASLLVNDKVRIYQVDKNIIPFSYGNSIFVNQHQHTTEELKEIIRHEFIHVKQRHTVDILWSECLVMLNWYNPFAWLIRRAVRQNLEFIADNKVLENGIDKKEYQYMLLKVIGVSHFSIAPKFNFSSLKKRIAMMNKIKTARMHLLRFMFILPLVAVLLLAFRNNYNANEPIIPGTVKYDGIIVDVSSQLPVADVSVKDSRTGLSAISDKNGYFRFDFKPGSSVLDVKLEFNHPDYHRQVAAFSLSFQNDSKTTKAVMELIGMKKGKVDENCAECFSSMSLQYADEPSRQGYKQAKEMLDSYISSGNRNGVKNSSANSIQNVEFSTPDQMIRDINGVIYLPGPADFKITQASKGNVIYKGKTWAIAEFFANHPAGGYYDVNIYSGPAAVDRFGEDGRNGVIVIGEKRPDLIATDTVPSGERLPKNVYSISIQNK
ncbi:MAG: hypothetical protein H7Y31_06690, partial [Chitinophagaceae bacterium]|nr:hypothetical protein [Chitinophagaceae bacterium]